MGKDDTMRGNRTEVSVSDQPLKGPMTLHSMTLNLSEKLRTGGSWDSKKVIIEIIV